MTEDRKIIWQEYVNTGGEPGPMAERMMCDYDRYWEADRVLNKLRELGADISALRVLDFGCGPADYGLTFARAGAQLGVLDINKSCLQLARFRMKREGIQEYRGMFFDLVIFGEVLEHLDDPLATLRQYQPMAEWIVTSSYPYRSDDPANDYWDKPGHSDTARLQQPACREFLEQNYERFNIDEGRGQLSLWRKRK